MGYLLLWLSALLCVSTTVFGQAEFGPIVGGRLVNEVYVYDGDREASFPNFLMPTIGGFYRHHVNHSWSLSSQLLLTGKGFRNDFGGIKLKHKLYYAEIPVYVERTIDRGIQLFVGPYLAHGLFGKGIVTYEGLTPDDYFIHSNGKHKHTIKFNSDGNGSYTPVDVGITAGLNFRINPFTLSAFYSTGLTNTNPLTENSSLVQPSYKQYHQSVGLTVAYHLKSDSALHLEKAAKKLSQHSRLGFRVGIAKSLLKDNKEFYNDDRSLFPMPAVGIIYSTRFSPALLFQTEASCTRRGDLYQYYTGFNRERTDTRVVVNYLEIPFLLRAQTKGGRAKLFVNGGMSLDYAFGETSIKADKRLNSPSGFRSSINREVSQRLGRSWLAGAGITFPGESSDVSLEMRYTRGLTDVFEEESKTRTLGVALSATFPMKK